MEILTPPQAVGLIVTVPIIIYTIVRLGTAAYFKSKEDYERTSKNGTQQPKHRA